MIDAVTQDDVVEFPNGLLDVFGDLEALQLHSRQLLAQLAAVPPGGMGRPTDQTQHPDDGQNESDQPVFHAATHCVIR